MYLQGETKTWHDQNIGWATTMKTSPRREIGADQVSDNTGYYRYHSLAQTHTKSPPPSNIWLGKCQSAWKGIKSLEMEESKTRKNSKELYTRLWEWKHNGLLLTDLLLNWCQVVSREILEKNLKPRKLEGVRAPLLYYHTCKEWFCIKNGLWCQHFCLLFH